MADARPDSWVVALPKAEVHVHLEGCFEASDLVELAAAAGEPLPRPADRLLDLSGIRLSAFLEFLDWSCSLVQTPEQVARAAYRFSQREAACGVRYADVIVNLTHWPAWSQRRESFLNALDAGFAEAEQDGFPVVGVCFSLLRQQSAAEADELVDWMLRSRHPRLVGLSIDGNESVAGRTGPRFSNAFRRAAEGGLHRTVHAGESSGPEGVWDAIDLLGAERIDHGIRAIEDAALLAELRRRQIPLGVCPGSNVALGLYGSRAEHPLDALRRAGVRVSINTDDPALMHTSLVSEYAAAQDAYGWPDDVLVDIARTSIESSFSEPALRRRLLEELDALAR